MSLRSLIMVKSGNYNFENKTLNLSVKYGTVPYFIEWVATPSLNIAVTLHNRQCYVIIMYNSGKLITVFVRKKQSSHSSQRARRPKQLNIPRRCCTERKRRNTISLVKRNSCQQAILTKYAGLKIYTCVLILRKALRFMVGTTPAEVGPSPCSGGVRRST